MARIRSIKPELRTSLSVAEWPREVRYFWTLLWGYLDDYGYGVDEPRLVKADCFPLDDDLTSADIDKWLDLIAGSGSVCRYVGTDGRRYLHAPKWRDHQKPQHPKDSRIREQFPCTRSDCGGPSGGSHEGFTNPSGEPHDGLTPERGEGEVVGDGEGRGNAQGATLPGTAILDAYLAKTSPRPPKDNVRKLSEAIDRLVAEKTPVDVIAEALERYRDKTKYGPSILHRLAADIVTERAEQAAGKTRTSANGRHRPFQNPTDPNAYKGTL